MRPSRNQKIKRGIPVYRVGYRGRQGINRSRILFIPCNGNRHRHFIRVIAICIAIGNPNLKGVGSVEVQIRGIGKNRRA